MPLFSKRNAENHRVLLPLILVVILLAWLCPGTVWAQDLGAPLGEIDHEQEYNACMALTRSAPGQAFEGAQVWEERGGGAAARHCGAVALFELEIYDEAAQRLEQLAGELGESNPHLAVEALGQAGLSWSLAGESEKANALLSKALEDAPKNLEILVDRGLVLASLERYWKAIDDFNLANELAPSRADVLVYRANAYRFVDAPELGLEDVERALALDPNYPEAYLERGNILQSLGEPDKARQDWLKVLSLAPEGSLAKAARDGLEAIDVKVEE